MAGTIQSAKTGNANQFLLVVFVRRDTLWPMAASGPEQFFQRTRQARKIMVFDLGFLGDTVHLLPALWMVRQAYPRAELHVAVAAHVTSLMDCVPWVNHVWGYMRYPRRATLRENFQMISRLRREKFDAVINLNGSDRSSWLTFLSGARERLGRQPGNGGALFWKCMFTAHVSHPSSSEPVFLQRCRCLEKAGFPFKQPEFRVEINPAHLRAAEISGNDAGTYFHISPFTTADYKELPLALLVNFIAALEKNFPEKNRPLLRADRPRTGKNGGAARLAAAKTVARFCRKPESDAARGGHSAQCAAFLRRHRHAASRSDDADAGCRMVLAKSKPR